MSNQTRESEKEFEDRMWNDFAESERKYFKDQRKKKLIALKEVKKVVTGYRYKQLLEYLRYQEDEMKVCEYRTDNKLTDVHSSDKQDADGWWKVEYVHQLSVGDTGDSFEGTVYIPLAQDFYLVFDYSC